MGCPDSSLLAAYVGAAADATERTVVESHLDDCDGCRILVAELLRGAGPKGPAIEQIGRYVLLEELGRGAIGSVYAAYDPELERKIAVKRLRLDVAATPLARTSIAREGKAIARLRHPNIVTVYDVGEQDGEVFIAMELIQGPTLREWLGSEPARPRIVEVFRQAASGLAKAHASGLIHRDFKPDNVLISAEGDVRITDFGLAHLEQAGKAETILPELDLEASDTTLAVTGSPLGTPAYMAPEVWRGAPATLKSDQYAFGVALYEALGGRRPHKGKTLEELRTSVLSDGTYPALPISAQLSRTVERLLADDPDDRFDSMEEVALALRPESPARGLFWLLGAAVVALAAFLFLGRAEQGGVCGQQAPLAASWNPARAAQVTAAFKGAGFAVEGAEVERRLDAYGRTWLAARASVCQERPPAAVKLSCLDERRLDIDAIVEAILEAPRAPRASRALGAVYELVDPQKCVDSAEHDTLVRSKKQRRAEALSRVGDLVAAHGELQPEIDKLQGRAPPEARELLSLGLTLEHAAGTSSRADGLYEQASRAAAAAGDDRLSADLARRHGHRLAYWLGRREEGELLLELVRTFRVRAGLEPESPQRLLDLGAIYFKYGEIDWCREIVTSAQALASERGAGPTTMATIANAKGLLDGDPKALEKSIELWTSVRGARHPELAAPLLNLAIITSFGGDYEQALELVERARAIRLPAHGPDHRATAMVYVTEARVHLAHGHYPRAEKLLRKALAIEPERIGWRASLSALRCAAGAYKEGRSIAEGIDYALQACHALETGEPVPRGEGRGTEVELALIIARKRGARAAAGFTTAVAETTAVPMYPVRRRVVEKILAGELRP